MEPKQVFGRFLFPSVLTALLSTTIFLLAQDTLSSKILVSSPIIWAIPFITSIICIFIDFRLICRNELNMGRIECLIFSFLAAILWTFFNVGLGSILYPASYPTASIIPILILGFLLYTGGAFFCAFVLPPIGLSLGKVAPSPPLDAAVVRKRKLLSLTVIVMILVTFIAIIPTPHIRSAHGNQSFPFGFEYMGNHIPVFLFGNQSIERDFLAYRPRYASTMTFATVVDVQSTEKVSISIIIMELYYTPYPLGGKTIISQTHVCYNETAKVHNYSFQQVTTGDNQHIQYVVTAKNPSPLPPNGIPTLDWQAFLQNGTITFYFPDGKVLVPLYMNGSINATWNYQYTEWTMWWSP